jgi:NADH-quinone oxidoreductase subunit L
MHHAAEHEEHAVSHATEWMLILGVSTASILVAFASFKKYSALKKLEEGSGAAFNLSWNKFYVDEIYQMLFARPLSYLADFVAAVFDRFVIEGIVNGSERVLRITGSALSMLQTGSVQTYAWYVAAGSALTLWILQRMVSR